MNSDNRNFYTHEKYNAYMDWVQNVLNPKRKAKGLNTLPDTEATFCWNILNEFDKHWNNKDIIK